jgi:hypothetical protein
MVVWLGYVVRKVIGVIMTTEPSLHFIGYLAIAVIYLIFALKS